MSDSVVIPHDFICPISLDIMKEPVVCADGNTYEKSEIEKWFEKHDTSPKTLKKLADKNFLPNCAIKSAIDTFEADIDPQKIKSIEVCFFLATNMRCGSFTSLFLFLAQLQLMLYNGTSFRVKIDKDSKVKDLMEEIEKMGGIPPDEQRLLHNGKQMNPANTLKHHRVTAESLVLLLLRQAGGEPRSV